MAKNKTDLVDPLDLGDDPVLEEKVKSVDDLSIADFKPIPQKTASGNADPFANYTMIPIKIEGVDPPEDMPIYRAHIVGLAPSVMVFQDPSGKNVTIPKNKKNPAKKVTIATSHSRFLRMSDGNNCDVVFDRVMKLQDGQELRYAIVRDHYVRSQIVFEIIKGKIFADKRYVLLDSGQEERLRALFVKHRSQELRHERNAKAFDAEEESKGE